MDMGRFLIEVHLRTGKTDQGAGPAHDVNPSWLFKLLRRYRLEGPTGLEPRSRRPKSSPSRIADLYEDEIVALRKELADAASMPGRPPSTSTSATGSIVRRDRLGGLIHEYHRKAA